MSSPTKRPSTETDLFFAVVCFGVCGALFFFLGQYIVYRYYHPSDVSPTWLAAVAILAGLIAVPAGLFYQRALKLNRSRLMIGVWSIFGILFLAFIILTPALSEYTFYPRIKPEISKHEETTPQGKIEYDDYIVHKVPVPQATWKVNLAAFRAAAQPIPIDIVFTGADGIVKPYSLTLVPGEQPKVIEESADYQSVCISSAVNSEFQISVAQPLSFSGNRAVVTNFGQLAVILFPLMVVSMLCINIIRQMFRTRRLAKCYSILLQNRQTGQQEQKAVVPLQQEPTYCGFLRLTKNELITMGIASVIVLFLRSPLFNPMEINCDEYYHTTFYTAAGQTPGQGLSDAILITGRFSYYIVYYLIETFCGVSPVGSQAVFVVLGTFSILLTGIFVAKLWKISSSVFMTITLLLVMSLHPYTQDIFFFRYGNGVWLFFPLTVYPFLIVRKTRRSILICSICLAMALGSYQTFFSAAITFFVMSIVIEGVREIRKPSPPSFLRLWQNCRVTECLLVIIFACLFYFLFGRIFSFIVHKPDTMGDYTQIVQIKNIGKQLQDCLSVYFRIYIPFDGKFGVPLNFIPFTFLFAAAAGILGTGFQGKSSLVRSKRFIFALFLLMLIGFVSYFAPLGILSFVDWLNADRPRGIMFVSLFQCGIFAVLQILFQNSLFWKKILVLSLSVLILSYSFFLSQLIDDIFKLAAVDRGLALRIIADIEKIPGTIDAEKICVLTFGHHLPYEKSFVSCRHQYFFSAFSWGHSRGNILCRLSGHQWIATRYFREEIEYRNRYKNIPIYPSPGSIVLDDNTVVIRLQ